MGTFRNRVMTSAALAVLAGNLFANSAEFLAGGSGRLLPLAGAGLGVFLVSHLALCAATLLAQWCRSVPLRSRRPPAYPLSEAEHRGRPKTVRQRLGQREAARGGVAAAR